MKPVFSDHTSSSPKLAYTFAISELDFLKFSPENLSNFIVGVFYQKQGLLSSLSHFGTRKVFSSPVIRSCFQYYVRLPPKAIVATVALIHPLNHPDIIYQKLFSAPAASALTLCELLPLSLDRHWIALRLPYYSSYRSYNPGVYPSVCLL